MPKKIFAFQMIAVFLASTVPALAAPPVFVNATVVPSGQSVVIPETAAQVADNVFYLGKAKDPASGEIAEGYAIVHYERGRAKSLESAVVASVDQCYTFIAGGVKWRGTAEPWLVNAANRRGLTSFFVLNNLRSNIAKWEDAANGFVLDGISTDILGAGALTTSKLRADFVLPDGKNEVYFANVSSAGAIAVTVVWYIPSTQTLVEWDQVYDDRDFDWSAAGEPGKMDFENIATHELGHSVGMGDLYNSCIQETMYGYAGNGEIKKRDLNAGDITGVDLLY